MSAAGIAAYEQGRGARRAQQARLNNPFPEGDPKHDAWDEGYRAQKRDDYTAAYSERPTLPRRADA